LGSSNEVGAAHRGRAGRAAPRRGRAAAGRGGDGQLRPGGARAREIRAGRVRARSGWGAGAGMEQRKERNVSREAGKRKERASGRRSLVCSSDPRYQPTNRHPLYLYKMI
jgi:hypothetical protein